MKMLLSSLLLSISLVSIFAAEKVIKPSDYKLRCHGSITDLEGKKEVNQFSNSENSNDWPIQIDLTDYPGINQAIWLGPKILVSPSFQVNFRTGRNMMQLSLGDLRHHPTNEQDVYHLAAGWASLSSEYVSLSYTRNLTINGKPTTSEVFVQCVLKEK